MIAMLSHVRTRRRELLRSVDVEGSFEQWEESCVPSYVHPNVFAAYVSWQRLFVAARTANRRVPHPVRVLDFGSSVGELSHILKYDGSYDFVEIDDGAAEFLLSQNKRARRLTLEEVPTATYEIIFAIDSLEHNENYGQLLVKLIRRLALGGILILSGPTENFLYRFGRRIAGFQGDYHHTTIFDIEREAARHLEQIERRTVPFGVPLFRITVWKRRND